MKKFTYLFAFMIFAFTLNAEILDQQPDFRDIYAQPSISTEMLQSSEGITKSKHDSPMAVAFEVVKDSAVNLGTLFTHYMHQTPISYDPVSGFIYYATTDWYDDAGTSALPVWVFYSTNMGSTWYRDKVMAYGGMGAFTPAISVTNNVNAQAYDDIPYTVVGRYCIESGTGGFTNENQGMMFAFHADGEIVEDIEAAPATNNPGRAQYWNTMKLHSYYDDDESQTYGACTLQNADFQQYGIYGYLAFNNMDQSLFISKIPTEFTLVFRQSEDVNSTYNGAIESGVDASGNVYAAVMNMFSDDPDNRVPAVAKSTDFGETFGQFNRMSTTIFDTYAELAGYTDIFIWQPYKSFGFIVHGEDSYSFFFTVVLTNTTTIEETHLVEAKFDGTRWSMHTISNDLSFIYPRAFFQSDLYRQDDWANQAVWRLGENVRAYEIQAAMTADGENVVVKWVDYSKDVTFPSPVAITEFNEETGTEVDSQLEGWYTADIFFAYRGVNESDWSGAINVTDDDTHYKSTFIPDVVPSLNQIPIIYHSNAVYTDATRPFMQNPYTIREHIVYFWDFIRYGNADLFATSVDENEINYTFELRDVVPNPASGIVEIPYVIDQPNNVKIEVHSAMGQKIAELVDEYQNAGASTIMFDVSNLSSGSYYVTMTVGGQRLTKMLNVIK
jgi:hypothetical protein